MTINIFMYIYIGENGHWDIYAPPPLQIITQKFFSFFFFILDETHQLECFFKFLGSKVTHSKSVAR